ncbi:MAG: hypothetical protein V2A62_01315 [Candidatus Woesearchaeota archaeon]
MKRIIFLLLLFVIGMSTFGCEAVYKIQNPLVGNWMASIIGIQTFVTIQPDNTIYFIDPLSGQNVFSYKIIGENIELTPLDGTRSFNYSFKVLGDYKAISINGIVYYPYQQ